MKSLQILNFKTLRFKSVGAIALLTGIWMCGIDNSSGQESSGQGNISIYQILSLCGQNKAQIGGRDYISEYSYDAGLTITISVYNPDDEEFLSSANATTTPDAGNDEDWSGTWVVDSVDTDPSGEGINILTATDNYNSSASGTIQINSDGSGWSYSEYSTIDHVDSECGFIMLITVCDPGKIIAGDQYYAYETKNSYSSCDVIPIKEKADAQSVTATADGYVVIGDALRADCPTYTSDCDGYVDKTWHIEDSLDSVSGFTDNEDEFYYTERTTGDPLLHVSDNQISPDQDFN